MPISIPVELDSASFQQGLSDLESKAKSSGQKIGDSIDTGSKKAKKSLGDATDSLKEFGDKAGAGGSSAGKLAGALGMISPQASNAARSVNDLADVAEVASVALSAIKAEGLASTLAVMGPLGLAVGAAALAFSAYQNEAEASEKATNDAKDAAEKASTAYDNLSEALFKATIKQKQLKGELTAAQAAAAIAGQDIAKQFLPPITEAATRLAAMEAESEKLTKKLGSGGLGTASLQHKIDNLNASIADQKKVVADLSGQYIDLYDTTQSNIKVEGDLNDAKGKTTETTKKLSEAVKQLNDTYAESIKAIDDDNAATEKASGLIDSLTGSARKSFEERLTGEAAIKAGLEDQLAALEEVYQQAIQSATSDQQRAEATEKYETARTEAVLTAEQKIQEVQHQTADKAVQDAKDAAADTKAAWQHAISGVQGGLEGIVGLIGGPVAGAITGLILNFGDTVSSLKDELLSLPKILKQLPGQLAGLVVTIVDKVIPGIIKAMPTIAKNLALAFTSPEFLAAILKISLYLISPWVQFAFWAWVGVQIFKGLWDAFKQGWAKFASGEMFRDIKAAILRGFVDAIAVFKAAWDKIIQAIKDLFSFKWVKGSGSVIGDLGAELVSLGTATTKTFGDSPSMQRSGPQGDRVRTSPGDYYAVGRNPQDLLAQALAGLSGGAQPAPAYVGGGQLNLAHQHRAFDGFFVRHATLGGQTSQFFKSLSSGKDARGLR